MDQETKDCFYNHACVLQGHAESLAKELRFASKPILSALIAERTSSGLWRTHSFMAGQVVASHEHTDLSEAMEMAEKALPLNHLAKICFRTAITTTAELEVRVLLHHDSSEIEGLPRLERDREGQVVFAPSLGHAVLNHFLDRCRISLATRNYLLTASMFNVREVIRQGASYFMYITALRSQANNWDLFHLCTTLSAMTYEKTGTKGGLLLGSDIETHIDMCLEFDPAVQLSEVRAARKLIQSTEQGQFLVANADTILGLGEIKPTYDASLELIYKVTFPSPNEWRLYCGKNLMVVQNGFASFPEERVPEAKFRDVMRARIQGINDAQIASLLAVVEQASSLDRGCVILISGDAKDESERLASLAFTLKAPANLAQVLPGMTCIDGAIILDVDANCFAMGVILDGNDDGTGNRSRGSRYNSSLRYVHGRENCVVVVVSDDGSVDILPEI